MRALKIFFWVLFVLVLTYTLAGFFGVPYVITKIAPEKIAKEISLHVKSQKASFNPFTYDLNIEELQVDDKNKKPIFASKNLHVKLNIPALLDKTIMLENIALVAPKLHVDIDKKGKLNLLSLVKTDEKNASSPQKSNWNFEIQTLSLKDANINLKAQNSNNPIDISFAPLNFTLKNLSTKKDKISTQILNAKISDAKSLKYDGSLSLNPLHVSGQIDLKEWKLNSLINYGLNKKGIYPKDVRANIRFKYNLDISDKHTILHVKDTNLDLENIQLFSGKDKLAGLKKANLKDIIISLNTKTNVLKLENANLAFENIELLKSKFVPLKGEFEKVNLKNVGFEYDLKNKADLNLEDIILNGAKLSINTADFNSSNEQNQSLDQSADANESVQKSSDFAFSYLVKNISVNNLGVDFKDGNFSQQISTATLHVKNVSSKEEKIDFDLHTKEDGVLDANLSGFYLPKPFGVQTKYKINYKKLELLNPYISEFLNAHLEKGAIGLDGNLSLDNDNLLVKSNAKLENFALNKSDKELVNLKELELKNLNFDKQKQSLKILHVKLQEPKINLILDKKGKTNLDDITKKSDDKNVSKEKNDDKDEFSFSLNQFALEKGEIQLLNENLPRKSKLIVDEINAQVKNLTLDKHKQAKLKLNAHVNKSGFLSLTGHLVPKDIKQSSKININLKNLNIKTLNSYTQKYLGYDTKKGNISTRLSQEIKKGKLKGKLNTKIDHFTLGKSVKSKDALQIPLEMGLMLLRDKNGNIKLEVPISGNMNDPKFSYGDIIVKTLVEFFVKIVASPFNAIGNILGIDTDKLKSVDFQPANAKIQISENEKMDNYVKIMQKYPKLKLSITGSYDSVLDAKSDENNESIGLPTLAKQRAENIKKALLEKGVKAQNIVIEKIKQVHTKDSEWIGCEMGLK